MKRIALALLLVAQPLAAADHPKGRTIKAKVDGSTYRVTVHGQDVEVANKAMLVVRTLETRDQMRRAVKSATGCEVVDDMWAGNVLLGKLACPTPLP